MLKLTVDPDPGYAVKEVFYTYNPTSNNLYAIFPKYPDNRNLILKDIMLPTTTKISFLSTKENLQWKQSGANVEISLPEYNPNKIRSPYGYAVKIDDFGKFASKPKIIVEYESGQQKPLVTIESDENFNLYYTTDGSIPSNSSIGYSKPFKAERSMTLSAIAYMQPNYGGIMKTLPSAITTQQIKVFEWKEAQRLSKPQQGINYKYFEPTGIIDLSSINDNPTSTGIADIISNNKKQRADKFAFEFTGYIKIDKDGIYTFFTGSDDGSMLYIDDDEIVNNDGNHGNVEKSGKAALKKGFHKIKVLYFDSGGGNSLKVSLQPPGGKKEVMAAALLFH
jgi:hypothetical protein